MRRSRREKPSSSGLRGSDMLRMGAGLMVLAILVLSIWRARDPRNWQWLADAGTVSPVAKTEKGETPKTSLASAKKSEKTAAKPKEKPADGKSNSPNLENLTDEDSEQLNEALAEFQAVSDGNLKLAKEEMEAYDRLVYWVKNQTFARLWERGRKNPSYSYLYDGAEDRRGQIVSLDVTIRLVRDGEKNRYGVPLHEAWAVTAKSRDRLYDLMVLDLPSEIPQEKFIREKARFAGYFLKLQGYYSAVAKPGQAPEIAPLLIGRIEWEPATPASDVAASADGTYGVLLGVIVIVVGLLAALFFLLRRQLGRYSTPPASLLQPTTGSVVSIDEWLERPDGAFVADSEENVEEDSKDLQEHQKQ